MHKLTQIKEINPAAMETSGPFKNESIVTENIGLECVIWQIWPETAQFLRH